MPRCDGFLLSAYLRMACPSLRPQAPGGSDLACLFPLCTWNQHVTGLGKCFLGG